MVAPTYKQFQLQCANIECGASYGAEMTLTHGVSPSLNPNPAVQLRMAPPRRADNDNGEGTPTMIPSGSEVPLPRAANDDDSCGEAVATGS